MWHCWAPRCSGWGNGDRKSPWVQQPPVFRAMGAALGAAVPPGTDLIRAAIGTHADFCCVLPSLLLL